MRHVAVSVQFSGSEASNYAAGTSVCASLGSEYSPKFPQHSVGGCYSRRTELSLWRVYGLASAAVVDLAVAALAWATWGK